MNQTGGDPFQEVTDPVTATRPALLVFLRHAESARNAAKSDTLRRAPLHYLAAYYVILIAGWVGAWYLHDLTSIRDLSPFGTTAYWTVAKLVIWIAPILLIVTRGMERRPVEYLGLVRFREGSRTGLAVGAAFVVLAALADLILARSHALPLLSWGTLNALVVAPLFEEIVFRGFALRTLQESGYGFWPANAIAGLLFLGLHLPGWHFTTGLGASSVITGASVVIVGMVAGYAKRRSGSTWASVIVHFLNNAYSGFVR